MIKRTGKNGSISLHYKGLCCSIFPLTKTKDFKYYKNLGENFMIDKLKQGYTLQQQILVSKTYCDIFYHRRKNRQKTSSNDHLNFCRALFCLLKLKQIKNDNENGY